MSYLEKYLLQIDYIRKSPMDRIAKNELLAIEVGPLVEIVKEMKSMIDAEWGVPDYEANYCQRIDKIAKEALKG